jgi:hypothetical protein
MSSDIGELKKQLNDLDNISRKTKANININKFMDALSYLACKRLTATNKDDLPIKINCNNYNPEDIVLSLNLYYGLGCLLLDLVSVRDDYDTLRLMLTEIDCSLKDSYEIIEKKEEL